MLITEGNPGQASALTGSTVAASNPSGEFRDSLSAQIAGQLSSTQTGRVAPQAAGASGAPASASARAALRGKDGRPANPPDFGNPKCAADLTPAVADSPIGALAMQAIPVPAPVVTQEGQADSDVCANAKTVTEAEVVKTVNIPSLRLPFGSLVPTGQNAKDTKVFSGETPVTEPEVDVLSHKPAEPDSGAQAVIPPATAAGEISKSAPGSQLTAQVLTASDGPGAGQSEARKTSQQNMEGSRFNATKATPDATDFNSAAGSVIPAAIGGIELPSRNSGFVLTGAGAEASLQLAAEAAATPGGAGVEAIATSCGTQPGVQRVNGAVRSDRKASPADAKSSFPVLESSSAAAKTQPNPESNLPSEYQEPKNLGPNQVQPQTSVAADPSLSQPLTAVTAHAAATTVPPNSETSATANVLGPPASPQTGDVATRQEQTAGLPPLAIQSARVLEHMGQTEMRVGVNTASFGTVELHATVNQDQIGASITTTHLELHAAMMAEMPSLQRAMEQHHLRLDSFDLNAHPGSQHSGSSASGNHSQSQPGAQSGPRFSASGDSVESLDSASSPGRIAPNSSGLNVHA